MADTPVRDTAIKSDPGAIVDPSDKAKATNEEPDGAKFQEPEPRIVGNVRPAVTNPSASAPEPHLRVLKRQR